MEKTVPVNNGAEAFLELLVACGVDYIFLNPGTDTCSIQEAVCKFKTLGKPTPEVVLCLHESVAMAAAHGYFMVSHKPQVVLVHADLGPQQVGGALHNAQRGRIGVVLCSGRVPSSIDKGRMNQIHWLQEQFDQAGVLRGYVKWEYELRTLENIHHVVLRAFQVASSEPYGPVYLCLPQDLLVEKMTNVCIPEVARHKAAAVGVDNHLLAEIGAILNKAENPLIISGYAGRHPGSVASLVELAEGLSARVISVPGRMNFPTTHPLFSGFDPDPYLTKADVIFMIDLDVPYIPARAKPKPEARIIHLDIDPLKSNLPLWDFPVDIPVQANSESVLPILNQIMRQNATPDQVAHSRTRLQHIRSAHQKMVKEWNELADDGARQKPISPDWLCHSLDEILEDNAIVLGEVVTNAAALWRQLRRTRPGTYFQSGGSNLGWGLGAALGARLASPDKTVVLLAGDGSFVFGCPTAALWAASTYRAPFLCIILNNMQYTAPKLAVKKSFGEASYSVKTGNWVGTEIRPSPDYAAIARACLAYGQTVEEPADVKPAIKAALEQVRGGRPAVLDVRIKGQ